MLFVASGLFALKMPTKAFTMLLSVEQSFDSLEL